MLLQALLLAILQGVTEFLPISSSAHLILTRELLAWQDQGLAFDVSLHLGSLGALILYFRRDLSSLARGAIQSLGSREITADARVLLMLCLATLPLVGLGLMVVLSGLDNQLRSAHLIAWSNLLFAPFLMLADRWRGSRQLKSLSTGHALVIGCCQALSVVPGASRSGVCMTGALMLGYSREEAARIAMLLAVPSILGAGILSGISATEAGVLPTFKLLAIGACISFLTAYASIAILLRLVERVGMTPFVIYRVVLGIALLLVLNIT